MKLPLSASASATEDEQLQQQEVVTGLLKGDRRFQVISHPGTSQYAQGGGRGISACGLAALNCARCLLAKASQTPAVAPDAFLHNLFARETIDEITSICDSWPSELHLEVDHIYGIPLFQQSLNLVTTKWDGKPGFREFKKFLSQELAAMNTSVAAVITRPPEIVTCIKFLLDGKNVFLIFDSHPRPSYPDGAAFIISTSIDATAEHLNRILAFDASLLADKDMQWQVQLLAQFSAHVFLYKPHGDATADLMDIVVKSSLAVLEMRAKISKLESQNNFLSAENSRLETEVSKLNKRVKTSLHTGNHPTRPEKESIRAKAVAWVNSMSGNQSSKNLGAHNKPSKSLTDFGATRPSHTHQASLDLDSESSSSSEVDDTSSSSSSSATPPLSGRAAGKQRTTEHVAVEQKTTLAPRKVSYANAVAGPSRSKNAGATNELFLSGNPSDMQYDRWESLDHQPQSVNTQDLFAPPPGLTASELLDFEYAAQQQRECDQEADRLWAEQKLIMDLHSGLGHGRPALANGGSARSPDFEYAAQQQRAYDREARQVREEQKRPKHDHSATVNSSVSQPRDSVDEARQSNRGPSHGRKPAPLSRNDDHERAILQQFQFDEEDQRLRAEQQELAMTFQQMTFDCGICLETCAEDSVCRVSPCSHGFCRGCIKDFVSSKLREHRFPVLCPKCTAEDRTRGPSVIDNVLAQQVGITDEENEVWRELELAIFSVMLHCRKCTRSAFVDREEYDAAKLIACPLPHCNYLWCKSCQQAVPLDGPTHSCDGSSELDHLMKKQGWKYCPGCKTPILKVTGCNHMTCMSPGCNTHFCYVCGQMIVRSGLRTEIQAAVTKHYQKCRLFEDAGA